MNLGPVVTVPDVNHYTLDDDGAQWDWQEEGPFAKAAEAELDRRLAELAALGYTTECWPWWR